MIISYTTHVETRHSPVKQQQREVYRVEEGQGVGEEAGHAPEERPHDLGDVVEVSVIVSRVGVG